MASERHEVVDRVRLRAVYEADREAIRTAADPDAPSVTRVVAHIVEDVRVEARAGPFVLTSDEPASRGGGGTAPTPLMYFAAGVAT